MSQDQQLVRAAQMAMKTKYGSAELYGSNNQYWLKLPNGKRALIKTGSKGQVMQRTHGKKPDSRFIGVADADLVVIAVKNSPNGAISVYEVPGDVYRNRMTSAYVEMLESKRLRPTDLRVLRFDGKGYPEQRVDEEWAVYMRETGPVPPEGSSLPPSQPPQDPTQAVETAKAIVAAAFGVPVDAVSVSVNM